MKSFAPYIFPAVVVLVLGVLIARWYGNRAQVSEDIFSEGVQIENLSQEELEKTLSGVGDFTSVDLEPAPAAPENEGGSLENIIRYEIADGKVRFGVIAGLEKAEETYQVWLREINGDTSRQAFTLEYGKGGYVGSAALSADLLPFEVLITRGDDEPTVENILYTGVIQQKTDAAE